MRIFRFAAISLAAIVLGLLIQALGWDVGVGVATGFTATFYELWVVK